MDLKEQIDYQYKLYVYLYLINEMNDLSNLVLYKNYVSDNIIYVNNGDKKNNEIKFSFQNGKILINIDLIYNNGMRMSKDEFDNSKYKGRKFSLKDFTSYFNEEEIIKLIKYLEDNFSFIKDYTKDEYQEIILKNLLLK